MAERLVGLGDSIPTPIVIPIFIGAGLLISIGIWAARAAMPELFSSFDDRPVAVVAVGGPALLAFGLLEYFHTPEPKPLDAGPARMSVGMDAMVDDLETRSAWVRRVAAAAIGIVHGLVFALMG